MSAFRRAQQHGEVAADVDPRSLARFLLAALQGLRVMGKGNPQQGLLADIAVTTLAGLPITDTRLTR